MPREQVDPHTPRDALEEAEELPATREGDVLRHVLAWILEGRSLTAIATRAYVTAYEVSPETINGMTLESIARLSGQGRSAAHNLARDFEDTFGVRSVHSRSDIARARCAEAYQRVNGRAPHTYNPVKK